MTTNEENFNEEISLQNDKHDNSWLRWGWLG